ncbi:hypothetical protein N431DRAFT_464642 [Stipitochalara longipes BDJ]|nr:hypothetical protein N431DRAFT_464642 [Stipitochalara longipes BDJ]
MGTGLPAAIGCGIGRRQETVQRSSCSDGGTIRRAGQEGFPADERLRQSGDAAACCTAAMLCKCGAVRRWDGNKVGCIRAGERFQRPAMLVRFGRGMAAVAAGDGELDVDLDLDRELEAGAGAVDLKGGCRPGDVHVTLNLERMPQLKTKPNQNSKCLAPAPSQDSTGQDFRPTLRSTSNVTSVHPPMRFSSSHIPYSRLRGGSQVGSQAQTDPARCTWIRDAHI